jgi:RNA 2',3'-cyclic 3'-phosphodiesterase
MAKRLFVAIDLPQSIRELLVELDPNLRDVRWVQAEQMHLTLGFFGNVTEDVDLRLREKLNAIRFGAFFLPIAGIGTFPPCRGGVPPKIIWLGVGAGHPHLFQIHKRVQEAALAAGLEPELGPWHPHITLARCHHSSAANARPFLKKVSDFDAGMIRVDAFHLYSSKLRPDGSIHTRELTVSGSGALARRSQGEGG